MPKVIPVQCDTASERDKTILGLALSIEDGWDFRTGDPEIYANEQRLVVPGGKVLDIGMGSARTSLFFAMHGMEVHGVDTDEDDTRFVNRLATEYDLPIHGEIADATEVDLGEGKYDVVILSQTFVHFPSTKSARDVLTRGIRALKPGGNLYLRAVGTQDSHFLEAADRYVVPDDDDPNVFYEFCGCSGEYKEEPHLFFDAIKLMAFMEAQGVQVWHSQVAPGHGEVNVMYGENWHVPMDPGSTRQMITLIGQKRHVE